MANQGTINWPGKSGAKYEYEIYPLNTHFVAKPGNYVFSKKNAAGKWTPIYIGETGDLSSRFTNHHRQSCIDSNGATHIHVHVNGGNEKARRDEETDLRNSFDPPCNRQ